MILGGGVNDGAGKQESEKQAKCSGAERRFNNL